jgi:phage terminase large subunit
MMLNKIQIPKVFECFRKPARYHVAYGGRGSGKSHYFTTDLLLKGTQESCRILCCREFQTSIKDSVKSLLDDKIKLIGLDNFYNSTRDVIVGKNGTEFVFAGLRSNASKIKSLENVKYCFIEEGQTISKESLEILIPTIRVEDSQIHIAFNPYQEEDPVYQMFVVEGRPNTIVKKVNYYDNPFFPNVLYREMDYDRQHDPDKYNHVWLGDVLNITEASVFKNKIKIDSFEAPEDTTFYLGLDPGFSQDYLAFIRCYIDHDKRYLFIDKAARKLQLEIDHTPDFLEQVIPDCKKWMITCDSARPELISYLRRRGFRIIGAKKGPGSINEGIEFIKNYTIIIHESLKDVIQEFTRYSYKIDSHTGQILPKLQDGNDHYVDSVRYALEKIRRPQPFMV